MRRTNKGFTLIELVIVLALLTVLTALAVLKFPALQENARKIVCLANRHSFLGELLSKGVVENRSLEAEFGRLSADEKSYFSCPNGGIFFLVDGKIECSIHGNTAPVTLGGHSVNLSNDVKDWSSIESGSKYNFSPGELYYHKGEGKLYYVAAKCTNYTVTDTSLSDYLTHYGYLKPVSVSNPYTVDQIRENSSSTTCDKYYGTASPGSVYLYDGILYSQVGQCSNKTPCDPTLSPSVWVPIGTIAGEI